MEAFELVDTAMARNEEQTTLIFGEKAAGLLEFLRPFETVRKAGLTDHYKIAIGRVDNCANDILLMLFRTPGKPRQGFGALWHTYLDAYWKGFLEEMGAVLADMDGLRRSRIVEQARKVAQNVINRLRYFYLGKWPLAAALLRAAWLASAEVGTMERRPVTREDARRALDLLIWLRDLEEEAKSEIEALSFLERIGESPVWAEADFPWKLIGADPRSGRGVPDHVRERWARRVGSRRGRGPRPETGTGAAKGDERLAPGRGACQGGRVG